jgi:hypothetical protein
MQLKKQENINKQIEKSGGVIPSSGVGGGHH